VRAVLGQLARRRLVEIVDEPVVVDGRLRVVGSEEVRRGAALCHGAVERGRLDDQVDDAEERRRRCLVRASGVISEMVAETEPAFRLAVWD
jgi:ribosome-associated protein YbcJ (S4-like RNA binding protein)